MGIIIKAGLRRLAWLSVLALFCIGLIGVGHVSAAPMAQITGQVTDPQGAAVSKVSVTVTAPGSSTVLYGPVTTNVKGNYTLTVLNRSTYDVHFVPQSNSGLNAYVESGFALQFASRTLNVSLVSSATVYRTVSGIVADATGQAVAGLDVQFTSSTGVQTVLTTDASGAYSASLTDDTYDVTLIKSSSSTAPDYPTFTIDEGSLVVAGNVPQNYQLPRLMHVTVTAHDYNGAAAAGQVVSYSANGQSTTATTDATGVAVLPALVNVVIPAGSLCTTFSADNVQVCNTADLTGASDSSTNLDAPLANVLSGTVATTSSVAVVGAQVTLTATNGSTVSATTNQKGQYSVLATPGVYTVQITNNGVVTSEGSVDLTLGNVVQDYQI